MKKYWIFILIIIGILIVVVAGYFIFFNKTEVEQLTTCGDGTLYDFCSLRKPYFCEEGVLVEKASVCGCSELLTKEGDFCISKYQTNPKSITLNYILNGEERKIDFVVYGGMVDYISGLPYLIRYTGEEQPSRVDFKLRNINEEEQRELLLPLVTEIQNLAKDREEQTRIAISLVQNIQYEFTDKRITLPGNIVANYSRYPYDVLYENKGICGEKSELLVFLLKELGYGTAFFYHQTENHESVGIKCPLENSLDKTGYCFIETTGPSIITDNSIEYIGGITLESDPEVFFISDGISLGNDLYEYGDARDMRKIRKGGFLLFKESKLQKLKEKYGLVEEYDLR